MCKAATCSSCSKSTWTGCGQHVRQVMAGVPKPERCTCKNPQPKRSGGWLSKLRGR